ncbi:hypothetical protein ['Camptotheca acuminata' phytoplasma]|uniref:hypothetical protein n=1 Tax='Camptotheca acuminata' phytoplasma TaxID=3239192 RepID=UPI00351A02B9
MLSLFCLYSSSFSLVGFSDNTSISKTLFKACSISFLNFDCLASLSVPSSFFIKIE